MPEINGPLLFGILVAVGVLVGFVAVWRITRSRDLTGQRLRRYGTSEEQGGVGAYQGRRRRLRRLPLGRRFLAGFGLGPRIATALGRADIPLTAAEYTLIVLAVAFVGFLVGVFRVGPELGPVLGPIAGVALGGVFGAVPVFYVRLRQARRQRLLTEQLPDVLTLLVGSLRAGLGLSQALSSLVDEVQPPAQTEFARVMRAVGLGMPIQDALRDMAARVGSDDLDLIVTAIVAQYDMGGNLAQTLETISETVRDRINLLREVRVLTAQQRFTGYVLALLPVVTGAVLFVINPGYMSGLFEPGLVRLLPVGAVVLQVIGFLIMRRIVDIEV
jgi:tight adherence protein B